MAVLLPVVPDEDGVGEEVLEADGDADLVGEGVLDGEGEGEGDGDGELEDDKAWQVVPVSGDELCLGVAADELGLGVAAAGLSEPARAMAGQAASIPTIRRPPASKLSVIALTCVKPI